MSNFTDFWTLDLIISKNIHARKLLLVVGKHVAKWGEIWFWERIQNNFTIYENNVLFSTTLWKERLKYQVDIFKTLGLYMQCNIIIHYKMDENNTIMKKRPKKTVACWSCKIFFPGLSKQKKGWKQK